MIRGQPKPLIAKKAGRVFSPACSATVEVAFLIFQTSLSLVLVTNDMPRADDRRNATLISKIAGNKTLVYHFVLVGSSLHDSQRVVLHVLEGLPGFHHPPILIGVGKTVNL